MTAAYSFNASKVLLGLLVLTLAEVAWGVWMPLPTWAVRAGLVIFALWKGWLIFTYFMHMKWEGWIVKALIAPTVPLVAVVVFATMPDVSKNAELVYPVGFQRVEETGQVLGIPEAADVRGYGQKPAEH